MPAGSPGPLQFFTFDEKETSAAAAWTLDSFAGNSQEEQPNHKQELISMLKPQLVVRVADMSHEAASKDCHDGSTPVSST